MATTTLTRKQQTITVPANTDEHDIDFDAVLKSANSNLADALITMVSGTSVQFDSNGVGANGGLTLVSSGNNTKEILEIQRGVKLKYKGGAGSEVFNISILSR